jgi:hypothetical protein
MQLTKLRETSSKVKNLFLKKEHWTLYILAFFIFVSIRGMAEIQAGDLPAGWDSMNYYAPWTLAYMKHGILNQHFIAAPPLVFILIIALYILTQNIWLAIKILSSVLYGMLGVSVLYFTRSHLSWSNRKSVTCLLLLMSQPAALRISWDLLKNQLAMCILFIQLPLISSSIKNINKKTTTFLIITLSSLIVLTHQYVATAYFVILLSLLLSRSKTRSFKKYIMYTHIPALILFIFIAGAYAGWTIPLISTPGGTARFFRAIHYVDAPTFSVFKNYLSLYGSYQNLFLKTITLFILLYALILPLIPFGFWHDPFLTPFFILTLTCSFLLLLSPSFALADFDRWLFMLVYPFAFYSANALSKLMDFSSRKQKHSCVIFRKIHKSFIRSLVKKAAIIYLLFLIVFGFNYTQGNVKQVFKPVEGYVPPSLSDKPVSSAAAQDIIANVKWVNELNQKLSAIELIDDFEKLNKDLWSYKGEGGISLNDSILTLDTIKESSTSSIFLNLTVNLIGSIEVKLKFNNFSANCSKLDLLTIRDAAGTGGGVIYCHKTLSYWDSTANISYDLVPLDDDWHTIKVTCNTTGTIINVGEHCKLYIKTGWSFGQISLGQTHKHAGYGGSVSIDYIFIKGKPLTCLITSFRELGLVWIYLDEETEIVTFIQYFDATLNFAKNKFYFKIFMLLPTDLYENKFSIAHKMQYYSTFILENTT